MVCLHGLFNVESFVDIPKTSCSTPSRLGTPSSPTEEGGRDNIRNAHKVMTQDEDEQLNNRMIGIIYTNLPI
eukprot:scaffold2723_cov266-Chaetoceros_neogracile.AAC.7